MHLQREFSMALSPSGYKTYVTGEDCHVAATAAIKNLIEETMDVRLGWQMRRQWKKHGRSSDRRNGYYERNLLTSWGWIVGIRVPRGRVSTVAGEVIPRYQRRQGEFDAAVVTPHIEQQ